MLTPATTLTDLYESWCTIINLTVAIRYHFDENSMNKYQFSGQKMGQNGQKWEGFSVSISQRQLNQIRQAFYQKNVSLLSVERTKNIIEQLH